MMVKDLAETGSTSSTNAELQEVIQLFLSEHVLSSLASLTFIHNAGSLGSMEYVFNYGKGEDDADVAAIVESTMNLNLTSPIALTGFLLQPSSGLVASLSPSRVVVINISSLLAIQAFPCWGLYGAHKAGRDQFFSILSLEIPATVEALGIESLRVLSYSPGPLDTLMQSEVREMMADPEQRNQYAKMKSEKLLVTVEASAEKCMDLLFADKYTDGAHIDYYDDLP